MSQEPSTETFQDLGHGDWEADLLNSRHILFVNEEFPAQVDVMLDQYEDDEAWHIGLNVYNPQRGMMDLLSSEYSSVFPRHDVEGVRDEISAYIEAVESGDLDDYRTEAAV